MDLEPKQTFFVHLPSLRTGPTSCSADKEIADHLPQLLALAGLETSIVDENNISVVVYPSSLHDDVFYHQPGFSTESLSSKLMEMFSVDVYVVPLAKDEKLSLNEIRSRLVHHYDREKVEGIDCLSAWRIPGDADIDLYPRGSVFTAKKRIIESLLVATFMSPLLNQQNNKNTISVRKDQQLVKPMEESLSDSSSSKRDAPCLPREPAQNLSHHPEEDNTPAVVKPHNNLEEEVVVDAPDRSKVAVPPGLDPLDTINQQERMVRLSRSSDCLPQHCGQKEHLTHHTFKKSFSDSNIIVSKKAKHMKDSSLVCGRAMPRATAGLMAACDMGKSGGEAEEYTHDERFNPAKEQRKKCSQENPIDLSTHSPSTGEAIVHVPVQPELKPGCCTKQSRGTSPGGANPVVGGASLRRPKISSSGCLLVPNPRAEAPLVEDGPHRPTNCKPVYLKPEAKQYHDWRIDTTGRNFPLKDELHHVPDRSLMYTNEGFAVATHLPRGTDCHKLLPPPISLYGLVKKMNRHHRLRVTAHKRMHEDDHLIGSRVLPQEVFLGIGGFGVTVEHALAGKKFALKWTVYPDHPDALEAWSEFKHDNIIPLLAVAKIDPDCYILMPRMTGDLEALMRIVGDLYSLALQEDHETWEGTILGNLRHILASVLHGLKYLHDNEPGYQHCDLKESNILYRVKCKCADIIHCQCHPEDKCDVVISDFDTLTRLSPQRSIKPSQSPVHLTTGTKYYRAPEAHHGAVAPCCDVYSFGIVVASICHTEDEKLKIRNDYKEVIPSSVQVCKEAHYGQGLLSSLRKKCLHKPGCLKPVEELAEKCLKLKADERQTARWLLESDEITLFS